ncbi:EAL and HDOD domain-containing protein [Vibrio viridaestus]|uniref:HDOD domain-containing protein n=1 Tax=Vibrio viridaestus TaxID=2487322 RepID=A0A3N9TGI4_9VIBR|nr:HDOD domain-containing protein [Vibrio viridaestus]RQW63279.1 HDOD domain-containing protein [Vibrio viridaestus]
MQYSYVARQAIFNPAKNVLGYELLFRDGPENLFPKIDSDQATSRLLSEHFLTLHNRVAEGLLTFVNFPYKSLVSHVPTLLPKERLVVEILEDCKPTQELLEAISKMSGMGYKLALDDFIPSSEWKPFLPFVNYIKFDITEVSPQKAKVLIDKLAKTNIKFIAEKVETYQEYQECIEVGFHLFQGYFFSKPEMIRKEKIDPSLIATVQLCEQMAKPNIDFDRVESIISRDVSLSYKLLTLVNNSPNVLVKIKSFKQAITYLGEERLRQFVSLIAIAASAEGKPRHLFTLSLQNAYFCEEISKLIITKTEPGSAFLTGIFCYLDSIMDQSLEQLLKEIPLSKEVSNALLKGEGSLGDVLSLAKAYDHAEWNTVQSMTCKLGISLELTAQCYDSAITKVSEVSRCHAI